MLIPRAAPASSTSSISLPDRITTPDQPDQPREPDNASDVHDDGEDEASAWVDEETEYDEDLLPTGNDEDYVDMLDEDRFLGVGDDDLNLEDDDGEVSNDEGGEHDSGA